MLVIHIPDDQWDGVEQASPTIRAPKNLSLTWDGRAKNQEAQKKTL